MVEFLKSAIKRIVALASYDESKFVNKEEFEEGNYISKDDFEVDLEEALIELENEKDGGEEEDTDAEDEKDEEEETEKPPIVEDPHPQPFEPLKK